MGDFDSYMLKHGKKVTFFYCHERFLPLSHPFRGDRKSFTKGKTVKKGPPKQKLGVDITKMLDDLMESENGKLSLGTPLCKGIDTTPQHRFDAPGV
jgi:hypothetical protein